MSATATFFLCFRLAFRVQRPELFIVYSVIVYSALKYKKNKNIIYYKMEYTYFTPLPKTKEERIKEQTKQKKTM
jgi:hypothetical protein